jgi:exodeoxyribonuclease VII large subunit
MCRALALCPLPVLCGIGHDVDEAIADMICHTSVKTPTAGAEHLVNHNAAFETETLILGQTLRQLAHQRLQADTHLLSQWGQEIYLRSRHVLRTSSETLHSFEKGIAQGIQTTLRQENRQLQHIESLLSVLRPESVMSRGYSLTTLDGRILKSVGEVGDGDVIQTTLQDGHIESRVSA